MDIQIPGVLFGGRAALRKRLDNAILLGVPTIGAVAAVAHATTFGVSAATVCVFLVFYAWTGFGATLGLHRYFTHRSFRASPMVAYLLGAGACFAMQGAIIRWVADHRRHHRLEDRPGDPHSPSVTPTGRFLSPLAGFVHAYCGWMFDSSVTKGQPLTISLGSVIKGWTDGMQLMSVGDKYRFWIPEELAYKDQPSRPQGMLVFDIELLEIKPPAPDAPPGHPPGHP